MDNRRRKLKLNGQLINELTRSDSCSESEPVSKRFCPSDVDDDSFEDPIYEVPEALSHTTSQIQMMTQQRMEPMIEHTREPIMEAMMK